MRDDFPEPFGPYTTVRGAKSIFASRIERKFFRWSV